MPTPPQHIIRWGYQFPGDLTDLEMHFASFKAGEDPGKTGRGLGRYEHFKYIVNTLWPKLEFNDWLIDRARAFMDYEWISWAGCGASGKTHDASILATVWWMCDPLNSAVILTSTTAKMIRKRAWSEIQNLWNSSVIELPGNVVDSHTTVQAVKGDDKHAIFAKAVGEGNSSKAAADIQGIHCPRILVIIDEATDTPEAIWEACSNLQKGCNEFKLVAIGNPNSYFDPHGRFSEPKDGWGSITVDSEEWETKRGICLHFDGTKSPNVLAGKTKYRYLISEDQVESARKHEGEDDPKFWKYTRGFWAPEGIVKTVMSENMCLRYGVADPCRFLGDTERLASLDPGFGGDRCILRFARFGELNNRKKGVEFDEIIQIKVDVRRKDPIHYQIASQVVANCKAKGVKPARFAMDASGEGGGLADIISREWDNGIHRVEFGGAASTKPVSAEDPTPANEAYANRVTELWFRFRSYAAANLIGGLDTNTIIEFCSRKFDDEKRKRVVESKKEMKMRSGRSPDLADACVVMLDLADKLGATISTGENRTDKEWEKQVRLFDSINEEENKYAYADAY